MKLLFNRKENYLLFTGAGFFLAPYWLNYTWFFTIKTNFIITL